MTMHTPTADPALPRSALRIPDFRRYFLVSCCSTFGMWILRFILGWSAWLLTESALWVGLVSTAMLVPTFILSPVSGVMADRINIKTGMTLTNITQCLVALTALALEATDMLSIAWLVFLAGSMGMVTAAHNPMRLSMMPRLIPKSLIPSGIGWSAMVFNTSRILGPALAAGMLALASIREVFLLSGLLFLAAGLLIRRIPELPPRAGASDASVWSDLKAGLLYAIQSPPIQIILALTMLNGLVGRTIMELLPAISGKLLAGDANVLALLTGLTGLGAILGGLIMTRQRGNRYRLIQVVLLALVLSGTLLLPVNWLSGLLPIAGMIFLLAITMTVTGTGCQALTQLTVADEFRGRVMSLWTVIAMGVPAIGAFLMGALADVLGFGPVLTLFGALALLLVALLAPRRHRLKPSAPDATD